MNIGLRLATSKSTTVVNSFGMLRIGEEYPALEIVERNALLLSSSLKRASIVLAGDCAYSQLSRMPTGLHRSLQPCVAGPASTV